MKINIGTNKGNIQGFEIDKPFEDICWSDLRDAAQAKYPGCSPIGWAPAVVESEKEVIGYKLSGYVSKEVADIVFCRIDCSLFEGGLYFIKGNLASRRAIAKAIGLNVLETWFTPVYGTLDKTTIESSLNFDINKLEILNYVTLKQIVEAYKSLPHPSMVSSDKFRTTIHIVLSENDAANIYNPSVLSTLISVPLYFIKGYEPYSQKPIWFFKID